MFPMWAARQERNRAACDLFKKINKLLLQCVWNVVKEHVINDFLFTAYPDYLYFFKRKYNIN